jgi:hypothetical protein
MIIFLATFSAAFIDYNPSRAQGMITMTWTGRTDGHVIHVGTSGGSLHKVDIDKTETLCTIQVGTSIVRSTTTASAAYVPSLDGFLFVFVNTTGYQRFPIPIRELHYSAPFRTETGEIFTATIGRSLYRYDMKCRLLSESHSSHPFPTDTSISGDPGILRVALTDHHLYLIGNSAEEIKYSEVHLGYPPGTPGNRIVIITATVSPLFDGVIIISVDGIYRGTVRINGIPTSVFGSEGKFVFQLEQTGRKLPHHGVLFTEMNGSRVAIPMHPLHGSSHFWLLADNLTALPGGSGHVTLLKYSSGMHKVAGSFFGFAPLRLTIDPLRPANVMDEELTPPPALCGIYVRFGSLGLTAFVVYCLIRLAARPRRRAVILLLLLATELGISEFGWFGT